MITTIGTKFNTDWTCKDSIKLRSSELKTQFTKYYFPSHVPEEAAKATRLQHSKFTSMADGKGENAPLSLVVEVVKNNVCQSVQMKLSRKHSCEQTLVRSKERKMKSDNADALTFHQLIRCRYGKQNTHSEQTLVLPKKWTLNHLLQCLFW